MKGYMHMTMPSSVLIERLAAVNLTRPQLLCLAMYYHDGLTQRAIGERLGISRPVVARRLGAGRRKLAAAGMIPRRTYTAGAPRLVTMDIDALDALGAASVRAVW